MAYIKIDGWRTNIRFSSAHVIPEYEKCGRLHGHSYAIHAKLYGKQDEKGIIIDFSQIKKELKMIADELDHRILIPGNSASLTLKDEHDQITLDSMGKKYILPKQDCIILPLTSTSAENLSAYILEKILPKIKNEKSLTKIEIGVDEGYGQGAFTSKEL